MKNILIVEDTMTIARIYQGLLRMEGHAVSVAKDGVEAIESLDRVRPDLVLLDLMLPWKNGIEVLKHIRSHPTLNDLPVIVFTNAFMGTLMREAMEAGATHCLAKVQTKPKEVIQTIRGYLAVSALPGETLEADSDDSDVSLLPNSPDDIYFGQPSRKKRDAASEAELSHALSQMSQILPVLRCNVLAASRTGDEIKRLSYLIELGRLLASLTNSAQSVQLEVIAQTSTALQVLTAKRGKTEDCDLRTIAHGVDCLAKLVERAAQGPNLVFKAPKVLLLDVDSVSKRLITDSLNNVGLQTVGLVDPKAALRVLQGNPFDLIILNADTPSVSGFELCREIRELELHKQNPVVIVTSLTNLQVRALSIICGADHIVHKPCSPSELAARALLVLFNPRVRSGQGLAMRATP